MMEEGVTNEIDVLDFTAGPWHTQQGLHETFEPSIWKFNSMDLKFCIVIRY